MANPDSLFSSGDAIAFASVAAAVAAFAPGGSCAGKITRMVRTMSDGLMQVTLAGKATAQDWIFVANVDEPLQCTGFTATGATLSPSASLPIKVYF